MAFYSRAVLRSCRMSDMFCSCAQAQEIFLGGWGQYKEGTSVGGRIKFSLFVVFFKRSLAVVTMRFSSPKVVSPIDEVSLCNPLAQPS